jgi:Uncharacterized protein conserved in bacteria
MTALWTRRSLCAAALGAVAMPLAAQASPYPSRPVRLIIPFPAGGGTDVLARILLEPLRRELAQPLVVENIGGAGGSIGTARAAQAAPDGYTVLLTLSSHTINPAIYSKLSYDAVRDFAGITALASLPQVLVAHPSFEATDVRTLTARAASEPGRLSYAAGNGSPSHIAGELFKRRAGVDIVHIPYRGAAPAITDVLAGQVPLLWASLSAVAPLLKQGRLKALAVSTRHRSRLLPDVPAMEESGIKDFHVDAWYAAFVPIRTPSVIVTRLHSAFEAAIAQPGIEAQLLAQGMEPTTSTPLALDTTVKREVAAWSRLVRDARIKVE